MISPDTRHFSRLQTTTQTQISVQIFFKSAYLDNVVVGKLVLSLCQRPWRRRGEFPEGARAEDPDRPAGVEGSLELALGPALSLLVRPSLVLKQQLPLRPPLGFGHGSPFPFSATKTTPTPTSTTTTTRQQGERASRLDQHQTPRKEEWEQKLYTNMKPDNEKHFLAVAEQRLLFRIRVKFIPSISLANANTPVGGTVVCDSRRTPVTAEQVVHGNENKDNPTKRPPRPSTKKSSKLVKLVSPYLSSSASRICSSML